jgi:hypothetical protein
MRQGTPNITWNQTALEQVDLDVDYHAEWKAFGRRRNIALFLLFTWPLVCISLFEISRNGLHQPVACMVIMLVWLVCALAAVWWAGEYRCPRCRRRYAALGHRKGQTNLTRGIFDRVCTNCKLTKFEIVGPSHR